LFNIQLAEFPEKVEFNAGLFTIETLYTNIAAINETDLIIIPSLNPEL